MADLGMIVHCWLETAVRVLYWPAKARSAYFNPRAINVKEQKQQDTRFEVAQLRWHSVVSLKHLLVECSEAVGVAGRNFV